jgi:arylsulfatase A-like enzyme
MTGMDPWNTGILGMGRGQGPMGTGFSQTLPGELSKYGYHTQGIGKMHFSPQRSLNGFHHTILDESGRTEDPEFISDYRQWFDANKTGDYGITDHGSGWNSWIARPYHAPEHLHPTNWTVNESIRFLQRRDPSVPFFLKVSFARPHSPYDAPPFYFDLYKNKELPEPAVGEWAARHDVPSDAARHDAWRGVMSNEAIHRARAGYYGSITHIDHQLGRLFMFMQGKGVLDNTLIFFTSDHGDMLGDHHLWRKTYAYEGSAHIPMIVRLPPDLHPTQIKYVDEPVTLQDVMPTLLETAGIPVPDAVDGRSLLPLVQGRAAGWRSCVHGEHSTCYAEEQEMQYLTDGIIKYIWLPRIGEEMLFNLVNDPCECEDLAGNPVYHEVLVSWRKRLVAILEPRNLGLTDGDQLLNQAGKPPIVSPKYRERMEQAGYDWTLYRQAKAGFIL